MLRELRNISNKNTNKMKNYNGTTTFDAYFSWSSRSNYRLIVWNSKHNFFTLLIPRDSFNGKPHGIDATLLLFFS